MVTPIKSVLVVSFYMWILNRLFIGFYRAKIRLNFM